MMQLFTDPVLRAPTIGSILMCVAASLVGVMTFLRRQSLIGESLSHAAYPGVISGGAVAAFFGVDVSIGVTIGAMMTALLGMGAIDWLHKYFKVRADAALCFVLSVAFGLGVLIASYLQFSSPLFYKESLTYLYGQAATLRDVHVWLYGILVLSVIIAIILFYKELQIVLFDREFAQSLGLSAKAIDWLIFFLVALAIVVGLRSVGVVLVAAMLIAPAAGARQWTDHLGLMLFLAGCFGAFSGFFGHYFAVLLTDQTDLPIPTGPVIVLVAGAICLFSLLFSPKRGVVIRYARIARFRLRCLSENLLKAIWRLSPTEPIAREKLADASFWMIRRLAKQGWIKKGPDWVQLTPIGAKRAARIVRLHRLWEVYLTEYLEVGVERVHRDAEEMEHILTPELETELSALLDNPQFDPHQQPIPPPYGGST